MSGYQRGTPDLEPLAPERRHRATDSHDPKEILGGTGEVECEVIGTELVGIDRLPRLRFGLSEARFERIDQQRHGDRGQVGAELVGGDLRRDRHDRPAIHRPRVERGFELHEAHAGLGVAGQDRPLHRRRTAPAGQQRVVHVDQVEAVEDGLGDDPAESDNDAEVGSDTDRIFDRVGDGQAELDRGRLHRCGRDRAAAAPTAIGAGHDQRDVESRIVEPDQWRYRHLRGAHVDQPTNRRGVGHGSDRPPAVLEGVHDRPMPISRMIRMASRR